MFLRQNSLLLLFPGAFCLMVLFSYGQSRWTVFSHGERDAVLVTGGAGFIGTHTIVQLLEQDRRVICVDNYVNSSPQSLERVKKIVGRERAGRLLALRADVASLREMEAVFSMHGHVVSHVIHFCGLKAVFESMQVPLEYYRDNIDSALVVVKLMQRHGVKNIVFSSSATVYGPLHRAPLKESMSPLAATNPYGRTKLMIEEILTDVAAADKTFQAVLLRYFNPIGAHPSGEIGESPRGVPNNLMPYVLQVASGKLPLLHVYGTDYRTSDGTCERDFIHVMDLADGHVAALRLPDRGAVAINLGTGRPTSVKQLIACVERAADKKIAQQVEPQRPGDLSVVFADSSKAAQLLHWKASRSLDEACRDGWNWQQKNVRGFD